MTTTETVIVTTPEPDPERDADTGGDVSRETGEAVAEAAGDAAAASADAVGEAVAESVQAIEASRAIDDMSTDATDVRLEQLAEKIDALTALQAQPTVIVAEPDPEPEEDEIQPSQRHPWFRGLDEWRGRD